MILDIRKQLQNPAFKFILTLCVIAYASTVIIPLFFRESGMRDIWVVKVNGRKVTLAQFEQELAEKREWVAALRGQYGQYAEALLASMGSSSDPRVLAHDAVVREELIRGASESAQLMPSHAYITYKLSEPQFVTKELSSLIPSYLVSPTQGVQTQMLTEYLSRRGMSITAFERKIEDLMARKSLIDLLSIGVYVPSFDVTNRYAIDFQKKKYAIARLAFAPVRAELKKSITPSDEQLEAFFARKNIHEKRYIVPEKRAGIRWVFNPKSYGITVNDAQIERFYNDNRERIYVQEAAQVQIRRILIKTGDGAPERAAHIHAQLVENPDSFATLATNASEDSATASKGGLVDEYITRGQGERSRERAAFILKENGDISPVIETSEGYEIIQRVQRKDAVYKPLKSVRAAIEQQLREKRFAQLFNSEIRAVLQQSKTDVETFASFVKQKGAVQEAVHLSERDTSAQSTALFKMALNGKTTVMEEGAGIVLELTEIQKPQALTLAAIKDRVENEWYDELAAQELENRASTVINNLKSASLAEQAATVGGMTVSTTPFIDSESTVVLKDLEKKGIETSQMLLLEKRGMLMTGKDGENAYIVQVVEVEPIAPDHQAQKRAGLRAGLAQERTQELLGSFIASLYRNATLETNKLAFDIQQ